MVTEAQIATPVHGVRLPHASERAWKVAEGLPADQVVLVPIPVDPLGRRASDAWPLDEAVARIAVQRARGMPWVALLDHAGPAAATWMRERPLGASDIPEPVTGRRPLALDAFMWSALTESYASAAAQCAARSIPCVLGVDADGLLHGALSPRTAGTADHGTRLGRIVHIRDVVAQAHGSHVDVALVVEDLCPGGLDATEGLDVASAFVARGVRRLYVSSGTAALPALRRRKKGGTARGAGHALWSAAWLRQLDAEIVALVPELEPGMAARAAALGLRGVMRELFDDDLPA